MSKPFRKPPDFDLVTDLREAQSAARRKVNEAVMFRSTYDAQLAALHQAIHDINARALGIDTEVTHAREHLARIDARLAEATEAKRPKPAPRTIVSKRSPLDLLIDKLKTGDVSVIPQIQALTEASSMTRPESFT